MQQTKPITEEGITIHQKGGRALRDSRPPGYFSKLVSKRWSKWRKENHAKKGKKKAKK